MRRSDRGRSRTNAGGWRWNRNATIYLRCDTGGVPLSIFAFLFGLKIKVDGKSGLFSFILRGICPLLAAGVLCRVHAQLN